MTFQKSSVGWELQQLTQRINEWIEARWRQESPTAPQVDLPQWQIPEWLVTSLFWGLLAGLCGWWLWQRLPLLQRLWFHLKTQVLNRSLLTSPSPAQRHSPQHWVLQAQKLARQEQYPEACRSLYFALLQWFDDQALIPESSSRTDGEYENLLFRLRFTPPQIDAATIVLQIHQRLCFSDQPIDDQDFLACQTAIQHLNF